MILVYLYSAMQLCTMRYILQAVFRIVSSILLSFEYLKIAKHEREHFSGAKFFFNSSKFYLRLREKYHVSLAL